jgi:hypothetical protein
MEMRGTFGKSAFKRHKLFSTPPVLIIVMTTVEDNQGSQRIRRSLIA